MRYVSTRAPRSASGSGAPTASFSDILLEGLAADGGLYVPEHYPRVGPATLEHWRTLLATEGYAALAAEVLALFVDPADIPPADLRALAERAYTKEAFGTEEIVPVSHLAPGSGLAIGHLSNGPTAAFKDMAMQLLGVLFEYELGRRGTWLTIVGATSGDTGSAAEYAMLGRRGVDVIMLSPAGRMTPFQQAQMFSIHDPQIVNVAVEGVFDDCQDLVKAVNADAAFKARHHVGAVNSINWARVVAQVIYYVACWARATTDVTQQVSFAVPTGNFGNILAGHVAREMGIPIHTLVLATNENNVLHEFFSTGVYRPRSSAETLATSSPSMDISKASNFERFIFDLLGRDGARTRELFAVALPADGFFDLSGTPEFAGLRERYGIVSATSTHADRLAEIAHLWETEGVLVDPHTADAVHAARTLLSSDGGAQAGSNPSVPSGAGRDDDAVDTAAGGANGRPVTPVVVLETALPVKFGETIREATGAEPPVPERFAALADADRHVVDMPGDVGALKDLIARHTGR
nr:threonine synthase [Actinomycetales bacterium]